MSLTSCLIRVQHDLKAPGENSSMDSVPYCAELFLDPREEQTCTPLNKAALPIVPKQAASILKPLQPFWADSRLLGPFVFTPEKQMPNLLNHYVTESVSPPKKSPNSREKPS